MPLVEGRSHNRLEELVQAAAQLGTRELESFVARVLALRARRLAPSLAKEEARLLQEINQGLPAADCLSLESFATQSFAIEHIKPVSRGGRTVADNLAARCSP